MTGRKGRRARPFSVAVVDIRTYGKESDHAAHPSRTSRSLTARR
jgi:hypothetical protein